MINNIVVAIDGSEHANKALRMAADLAAKYQTRLYIFHVLLTGHVPKEIRALSEVPATGESEIAVGDHHVTELRPEVRVDIAERILARGREIAAQYGAAEIETHWDEGPTANCILEHARTRSAEMVVVGSRGVDGSPGLPVGSVSGRIAQLFEGSILTVR